MTLVFLQNYISKEPSKQLGGLLDTVRFAASLSKNRLFAFLAIIVLLAPCLAFETCDALTDQLSPGTILIKPDGTVVGSDKLRRDGNVYTLTSDVNLQFSNAFMQELTPFLVIEKSNIGVNGAGHTVTCNGTGLGIYARGVRDVTIANFTLKGFTVGISSYICDLMTTEQMGLISQPTSNNQILDNNIEVVSSKSLGSGVEDWGIYVEFAQDTYVNGNTITAENPTRGLYVGPTCNRTTITNNKLHGCGFDFYTLAEKTISGNTIDGKPIVFVSGKSGEVIDGGEQVLVYNCDNVVVKNIQPNNSYRRTIQLEKTVNSTVTACDGVIVLKNCTDNTVYGNQAKDIGLFGSNFNKIYSNFLSSGYVIYPRALGEEVYGRCIDLSASRYNDIYNNTIRDCTEGIHLGEVEEASQYNNIYQNDIYNASVGIRLTYCPENYIYSNNIHNCTGGINLLATNKDVVVQNNITQCLQAVAIMGSNNQIYHNNFVDNTKQASIEDQMLFSSSIVYAYSVNNTFDNGYPAGGNYWSSFQGVDLNSDGISETPYIIRGNSSDRYPFMHPVSFSDYTPPIKPPVTYEPTPTPTAPPATETPAPTQTMAPTQTSTPTLQPIETTRPQQTTPTSTVTSPPEAPELQTLLIIPALVGVALLLVATELKKRQGITPKNP